MEGDPDWGRIAIGDGDEVFGPVHDFQTVSTRRYKLLENKYGAGAGLGQVFIRGSAGSFNWNDALPAWETYTGPIVRTWRYVQAKLAGGA